MKKLLFIGDSITEHDRFEDKDGIGQGYVGLIYDYIQTTFPEKNITIINKGIKGDEITHFEKRWRQDVIDLQPDYLSISVGINDVWGEINKKEVDQAHLQHFKSIYQSLLKKVQSETTAQIILMEPTMITKEKHPNGNLFLKSYVNIIQELSKEFAAIHIPTFHAFTTFQSEHEELQLTSDGIHMTRLGSMLLAKVWWQHAKEIFSK